MADMGVVPHSDEVLMPEDRSALIRALAEAECLMHTIRTQEDVCAVIARVTIAVRGAPTSETELFSLAWGNAQGLFAEVFDNADEGQRWAWIDMCERALRDVVAAQRSDSNSL
jgi:hypothetical protein